MNADTFAAIRALMNERRIDCFPTPDLPPLDMGEDAVRDIARSLEDLAAALGLEFAVSEYQPLFRQVARTNTRIEMQLLNLQLNLFRAMIILGYDFPRMEAAMRKLLAAPPSSIAHCPSPSL